MIELQKAKIESWQNLNKEDYDLFVEMKGQEKLTILLDTEDVHYKSVYHLKSLQQESMPFSSINDMFSHLQECKAIPKQGQLIHMKQIKERKERKSFVLKLEKSEQQLGELRWQTRKKFKKTEEQLALHRQEQNQLKWKEKFRRKPQTPKKKSKKLRMNQSQYSEDFRVKKQQPQLEGLKLQIPKKKSKKSGMNKLKYQEDSRLDKLQQQLVELRQQIKQISKKFQQQEVDKSQSQEDSRLEKLQQQLDELRCQMGEKFQQWEVNKLKYEEELEKLKLISMKNLPLQPFFPLVQKKNIPLVEDEERQNEERQKNMGEKVQRLAGIIKAKMMENSPTLRNILKADEETKIEKIQHLESLVDEDTPRERNFRCRGNTITLNDSEPKKDRTQRWQQQILLRTVIEEPFTFQARINCGKEVIVGIVDRRKQRERSSSYRSGNAICYSSLGEIWFNQKGRAKVEKTDDQLASGSDLVIKVAPKEGSVRFTVRDRLGTRHYSVHSQILQQEDREFVPYFEMVDIEDSIDWQIIKKGYLSVQNEQSYIQEFLGLLKQLTSHSKSAIEKVEDD